MEKRFCQTCPKRLDGYPTSPCDLALNKLENRDGYKCDWYINHPESNYCFWLYIAKEQNQKPHTLQQIAILTNTSINNIKLAESAAMNRIRKAVFQQSFTDNFAEILEFIQEE